MVTYVALSWYIPEINPLLEHVYGGLGQIDMKIYMISVVGNNNRIFWDIHDVFKINVVTPIQINL